MKPYIAVDLDGTLAYYDKWRGAEHIGEPIPLMLTRVKHWLAEGRCVKIFTARASVPEHVPYVKAWLAEHGLPNLEVTNIKDYGMIVLYDDRAIQVEANTGRLIAQTDE